MILRLSHGEGGYKAVGVGYVHGIMEEELMTEEYLLEDVVGLWFLLILMGVNLCPT